MKLLNGFKKKYNTQNSNLIDIQGQQFNIKKMTYKQLKEQAEFLHHKAAKIHRKLNREIESLNHEPYPVKKQSSRPLILPLQKEQCSVYNQQKNLFNAMQSREKTFIGRLKIRFLS